jgi:membrane peptidoglycan carboxypeptidase
MSDRLKNLLYTAPDEPQGGWKKPQTPGGWRAPGDAVAEEPGWTTPKRIERVNAAEGWKVIKPGVELAATAIEVDDEDLEPVAEDVLPYDDQPAAQAATEATAAEPVAEAEATPEVLPFDGDGKPAEETLATLVESLEEEKQADKLTQLDDDEDEDSFSMSELVALASLVDEQPRARLQPAAETATPAAPVNPDDPAEVARRMAAQLSGQSSAPVASGQTAPTVVEDPAEYARRMAQQLATSQPVVTSEIPSPASAAPVAPAMSQADQELLAKYRTAENAIRAVRDRFRRNEIGRDQMQAELRQHMVLDEAQTWWMMGVETDAWYRYENGQWVVATPRVLQLAQEAEQAALQSIPRTTVADPGAASLPLLPDEPQLARTQAASPFEAGQTVPTQAVTGNEGSMPLPRAVPLRDPDATMPGTPGVYLDPVAAGQTVVSQSVSAPTIANAAIDPDLVIASPLPTVADAAPSYDVAAASPTYEKAKAKQQQTTLRNLLIIGGVGIAALLGLLACGIIAGVVYYQSLAAPWQDEVAALANYQPQFRTARILAADGSVIAELTSQQGGARDTIPLEEISPYLIHALISTENERYYEDPGWDAIAIARAFLQNFIAGEIESGATTLTQQIASSLVLQDTSATADVKLQEIVIASLIAQQYDKNFVLELYLNEFFFGNQSYGVEAASQFYFGKSAADLNMPEAAMIAGLLQAPATYDPVINREASFDRMEFVLNRMATVGCLQFQHAPYLAAPFCVTRGGGGASDIVSPQVTLEKAMIETAAYEPREFRVRYPHFVNYIQQIIEETYGTDALFRSGFEITTTLVPTIQDTAQTALLQTTQQLLNNGVQTGAVMVTDPRSGAILAMVGSPDFNNTQFEGQNNFAFLPQQPGSSIKPITYTAALEGFVNPQGQRAYWTPATVIWDVPTTYNTNPPYSPVNFDRQFHGPQTVRSALQNSYNVPAVKAYSFIGAENFRNMATRMGLNFADTAQFGLATALGAEDVRLYDMMVAYGTLANDGVRTSLYTITRIRDFQGNDVVPPQQGQSEQVISPALAYVMQSILSDNQSRIPAFGANSPLVIPGYPDGVVAAKTGTSNDNRDLWTMGFTNNTVVGVWMGRIDNNPTTGSTQVAASPVWNVTMRAALQNRPPEGFGNPGGVIQAQVCGDTGVAFDPAVNPNCTAPRVEFFLETQPPPTAGTSFVQQVTIDTWSGLIATQACPENVVTRTYVANIDDPFAIQWLNSPSGQAFAQRLGLPTPVEIAPQQQCPAGQQPNIRLTAPGSGQQLAGIVDVTGIVSATDLDRWQIELAPGGQENFTIISGVSQAQQPSNAVLYQWNTATVPNGIYQLRLHAVSRTGGFIYSTVNVGVNNVAAATATPLLPTAIVPGTAIPFPTAIPPGLPAPAVTLSFATATPPLIPAATAQSGLFPTATNIPFGGLAPLPTVPPGG